MLSSTSPVMYVSPCIYGSCRTFRTLLVKLNLAQISFVMHLFCLTSAALEYLLKYFFNFDYQLIV